MIHWEPTASVEILQKRAKFMDEIRAFFRARDVLEVETPLLAKAPVTDPYIDAFSTHCRLVNQTLYLQTSPEYAMKRLIAAGVGSCFQICKAFREDEAGRLHHPEFTMLEWYRLGFDEFDLMDEVDALMQNVLGFCLRIGLA
ncbi:MAG: elongation factor P lysine(34) lysyltransferase, partial [Gammaproteobacteria bacterium]|nr:elongation factor P lysine(34) lysyltransferase [Gammaproteobacteria bacterium]